jgi:hypothetical protein
MKKNYFICLFIVFIIVLCVLYFYCKNLDTKQSDNKINVSEIYDRFISDKKFLNNYDRGEYSNVSYVLYDLDKNGVDELIVYLSEGTEFGTNLIYTYDGEIIFVGDIYNYGNLAYNESERSIVYTDVRPSLVYGAIYGFYKFENNQLVLTKTLGVEIDSGVSNYYSYDDDEKIEISKDVYDDYFDNNVVLNSMFVDIH